MVKKFIAFLVILIMILSFGACGNNEEESMGSFYTLQEAYENELLTKDDMIHIVYFLNGEVFEIKDGQLEKLNFIPQTEVPDISTISTEIIDDMKETFYNENKKGIDDSIRYLKENGIMDQSVKAINTVSFISFLGKYNDCFAVQITSSVIVYGTSPLDMEIDGIVWIQSYPHITVFSYQ